MPDYELLRFLFSEAGVWAGLSIVLILYNNKRNEQREIKYQDTIEKNQDIIAKFAVAFEELKDVKHDIKDIKFSIEGLKKP